MTEPASRPQVLALHRPAWVAVREMLRSEGITQHFSLRLLYGWRSRLQSLAWRIQPRPAPASGLPIDLYACGFWRSGTTLLHECLACDPRWRAPTTQECMNPGQPTARGKTTVIKRPMDNLSIAADSPQEDEFGLMLLGAPSFYRILLCPRAWRSQLEELAAGDRHATWKQREAVMREFCAWLTVRDPRPLLIKSPNHAFALVRMLELAPGSRAVVILRDPRAVRNSCLRMWSAMFGMYALAPWTARDVSEMTLATMLEYARALQEQLARADASRVAVIRYEDLVAAPIATLAAVYAHLGWARPMGFDTAVAALVEGSRPTQRAGESVDEFAPQAAESLERAFESLTSATQHLLVRGD